jgi:hypothetical protein
MSFTPTSPEALREDICFCGHSAGEHADENSDYERGKQTEGPCLDPDCECDGFVLMGK